METLIAYKGDKKVKAKYLARVKAHEKADEIVKGQYWQYGKGCAVGCTIEGSDHRKYETELGIPIEIAYLEDTIFENLPNGEAKKFPAQFLSAIKVGADLSKVIPKIVIWQFEDKKHGLRTIKEVADDTKVMGWCYKVVELYRRRMDETIPVSEYNALYQEIARAGAGAGAWAWVVAGAWAGAWAGARAGAGAEYDERMLALRDEFLRLLKECK